MSDKQLSNNDQKVDKSICTKGGDIKNNDEDV
jgi:hypothetical protein